jgi:hypothetical protein
MILITKDPGHYFIKLGKFSDSACRDKVIGEDIPLGEVTQKAIKALRMVFHGAYACLGKIPLRE